MHEELRSKGLREKVETLRDPDHMIEVLQIIGLKYKTMVDLRSGFLIKSLLNSQRLVIIGCLNLNLRREKILIYKMGSLLVESVVKSTLVIALSEWIFTLVVARVVTR